MDDNWTAFDTLAFQSWAEAHEDELPISEVMGPPVHWSVPPPDNPLRKYVVRCAELIHERNAAQAEAEKWRGAAANWCEIAMKCRNVMRTWIAVSFVMLGILAVRSFLK